MRGMFGKTRAQFRMQWCEERMGMMEGFNGQEGEGVKNMTVEKDL